MAGNLKAEKIVGLTTELKVQGISYLLLKSGWKEGYMRSLKSEENICIWCLVVFFSDCFPVLSSSLTS